LGIALRRPQRFVYGNKLQTKRTAPSETHESGSEAGKGRSAAIRKERDGHVENGKLDARNNFNPGHRDDGGNVAGNGINVPMRDGDDGAIVVIIGNRSAVQPRVKRRMDFRRRQEQPYRQRQNSSGNVKTFPRPAIELARLELQIVCNVASGLPPARLIFSINIKRLGLWGWRAAAMAARNKIIATWPGGQGRFAELKALAFCVWHQARKWKYRINPAIRLKPAAKFVSTRIL
jgi:hypothetical protein